MLCESYLIAYKLSTKSIVTELTNVCCHCCAVQKELENLEDAETDLMMLEDEPSIPYPLNVFQPSHKSVV